MQLLLSQTLKQEQQQQVDSAVEYSNFIDCLRAQRSKENYDRALKMFMIFHNITTYLQLLQMPIPEVEEKIKTYILDSLIKELSTSFMKIFMAAIKNFFEMNEIENIRWRKLKRFMGEETPKNEDRCYTHEEIQTLLNLSNLKLRVAILLMCTAGLRLGLRQTVFVLP